MIDSVLANREGLENDQFKNDPVLSLIIQRIRKVKRLSKDVKSSRVGVVSRPQSDKSLSLPKRMASVKDEDIV